MTEQLLTEITTICTVCILIPIIGMTLNFPFKGILKQQKLENFEAFLALTIGNCIGSLIGLLSII